MTCMRRKGPVAIYGERATTKTVTLGCLSEVPNGKARSPSTDPRPAADTAGARSNGMRPGTSRDLKGGDAERTNFV